MFLKLNKEWTMTNPLSFVVDPFKVIKSYKIEFFIWFVFTIFAGQLGILANIIIRYFTYSIPVSQSIYLDSFSGSFYTYAIAIAASALGPLFANFIKNKKPQFTSLKVVTIVFVIFFLIIYAVIYSASQMKNMSTGPVLKLATDWTQISAYIISIFIGSYAYCLMKIEYPEYEHLDDKESYNEQDDDKVKKVVSDSKYIADDGSGVKL